MSEGRAETGYDQASDRGRPALDVVGIAIDELHRVVRAIFVEHALGSPAPPVAIRISPLTQTLKLVILDGLNGLQLAQLSALLGPSLDVEFYDGELVIFSPSVRNLDEIDDRRSIAEILGEMPGERDRPV